MQRIRTSISSLSKNIVSSILKVFFLKSCSSILKVLFIIVIDYVMRTSVDSMKESGLLYQPRKSSRHPALYITDADFADDIALLSDNLAGAQALLSSLESAANCAGLHLNESKTECMPINVRNQGVFQADLEVGVPILGTLIWASPNKRLPKRKRNTLQNKKFFKPSG